MGRRSPTRGPLALGALLLAAAAGCEPAPPAYDLGPPRVVATLPTAGATGVDPGASVEVTFDEPVGPLDVGHVVLARADVVTPAFRADLDADGLGVRALDDAVPATVVVLDDGRRARLEHSPLERGVAYALLVSAALNDLSGNALAGAGDAPGGFEVRFTTASPGPTATLVTPDPAAGPVPPNLAEVRLSFDGDLAAVRADGVRVEDAAGRRIPGEAFLSADRRGVRRTLGEPLAAGGRYAVVLGDLRDAAGVPATGGPWGFDVAACVDARAPTFTAELAPADFSALLAVRSDEPGTAGVRVRALEACGGTPAVAAGPVRCEGPVDPCGDPPAPGGCTAAVELRGLCPETAYEATPTFADAAGHETVGTPLAFRTLPPAARPRIAEVLADAASPEEGGEFVEVVNDSPEPWDPTGWMLVKVTATGQTERSLVREDGGAGPIPGSAVALYASPTFDAARYGGLPAAAIRLRAATTGAERAVFGNGLSNASPPAIELRGPGGVVLSAWPSGVRCPEGKSAARDPGGAGEPSCGDPTPGAPHGP